jgi:hypothetical protein
MSSAARLHLLRSGGRAQIGTFVGRDTVSAIDALASVPITATRTDLDAVVGGEPSDLISACPRLSVSQHESRAAA